MTLPYSLLFVIPFIFIISWLANKDETKKVNTTSTKTIPNATTPYSTTNNPKPTISNTSNIDIIQSHIPQYIEKGTEYESLIKNSFLLSFSWIRQNAANYIGGNSTPIYHRGVLPLVSYKELYQYMFSYGNMHYAKMKSALEYLPNSIFQNKIEIIDWGCGQGIATITLLQIKRPSKVSFILIEPGKLALERAALNVKYFHKKYSSGMFSCRTIHKDFDSLNLSDVCTSSGIKIHLFSNTLDIVGRYNQYDLMNLIKKTQKGLNYFVCVSPYQDDERRNKIDNFVSSFRQCANFKLYYSIDNSKDDDFWNCNKYFKRELCERDYSCNDCYAKWTRIIRVFSVNL